MTNSEIIFAESVKLMKQGKIKSDGTGNTITVKCEDGTEEEILIPEAIATYQAWKRAGAQVKKGEHAVAKIKIWMPNKKKQKEEPAEDEEIQGAFFLKTANFFAISQCEIAENKIA